MITERTLRRWRREALIKMEEQIEDECAVLVQSFSTRILRMTQELLDQHLLRKKIR